MLLYSTTPNMKALLIFSSLFIFSLSFVPFAFSRNFPFSPPVLDTDGKELKLGAAYYVLSQAMVRPEGLCLADVKDPSASCPHDIVQCTLFDKSLLGSPIIFSLDNSTEDVVVRESTSYDVQFSVAGNCSSNDTAAWTLAETSSPLTKYVGTYPDTPAVQFQVQKSGLGYNIVYCEIIPLPRTPLCFAVGFIQDGFYSRLGAGIGVQPVQFLFVSNETVIHPGTWKSTI